MNIIYKYIAVSILITALLSSCSTNDSDERADAYSERVEPILAGNVYPSTFQIYEKGNIIGYQVNIVASLNLTDTIGCTINVIDENNALIPSHLMGGGIEEFEDREFTLSNGKGRMIHIFIENPEKLNKILLTTSNLDKVVLFNRGDSIGVAGNYIKPEEYKYK